jgi:hypothetical protein
LREPGSYHAPGSFSFKAWPAESKLRSPQASGAGPYTLEEISTLPIPSS